MFCDLVRYELSARGSMCGHDSAPLTDAILLLPHDSSATIDLRDAAIDATAAAELASAVQRGQRHGVEFSILVGSDAASATLSAAGLTTLVIVQPHHHAFA